ncbi:MAG: hypothetical protein Q8N05_16610 [Bacteroidota bacterium]|nr:hypothetical protein [Bacteroidota bacterium]
MKKLFTTLFLTFLFVGAYAQISIEPISIGLHANYFNAETKDSPKNGYGFSVSFNRIYMDISSNFSGGKGEYLEYSSQYSYSSEKIHITLLNFGYIIPVKSFSIIPVIGFGESKEIYQDPVGWETYYFGKSTTKINLGIIGTIKLSEHFRFHAGVGTFENFKAGLSYYAF